MAFAFGIEQQASTGVKIRRGDDWRRSLHNSTTQARSRPDHHTIDDHVAHCRALAAQGHSRILSWGHDQEDAYRVLPAEAPSLMYVIVMLADGPSIWQHLVLNFGSRAAVWNYNRFSDALMMLFRLLLFVAVGHYVDDFNGDEGEATAASGFEAVTRLSALLGFPMKDSKAQPPQTEVLRLGTLFSTAPDGVTVRTKPGRVQSLTKALQAVLAAGSLSPALAGSLAGKATFTCAAVFGKVGRAATKALYARQYGPTTGTELPESLRSSILSLIEIINVCPPRFVPFASCQRPTIIYADAFFAEGDRRFRAAELRAGDGPVGPVRDLTNGFGFVIFWADGSRPVFLHAEVPHGVLETLPRKKQYIFFLETFAQSLALWVEAERLCGPVIAFDDNEASKHALTRGHSGDPPTNALIASYWLTAATFGVRPWFDRVATSDNVADAISRGELDEAHRRGWQGLPPLPRSFWPALLELLGSKGGVRARTLRRLLATLKGGDGDCGDGGHNPYARRGSPGS